MKRTAIVIAAFAACVFLVYSSAYLWRALDRPVSEHSAVLSAEYTEGCLTPESGLRPVWECYRISVAEGGVEYGRVVIEHESGVKHHSRVFSEDGGLWFRFTPDAAGEWRFSTGGAIIIDDTRPGYAQGFVVPLQGKWARSATGKAFVPQWVMYDRTDLDRGLNEFVDGHGFTGFHITNLRDFLDNPAYFEAVVLKTYRRGGATYFWIWGDAQRNQTPATYGVDTEKLYNEIIARLAPIPGWTVGYGFDLHEWAGRADIEAFRRRLREQTSYPHMVGARGYKNEYRAVSDELDYYSWEWHRPTYNDYLDHIDHAHGKPAVSADRFRIRTSSRYPDKDYTEALTLTGLWDSLLAGGIANIWGKTNAGAQYSQPYDVKTAIKTYSIFADKYFRADMRPVDPVDKGFKCLAGEYVICKTDTRRRLQFSDSNRFSSVTAVDVHRRYEEVSYPLDGQTTLNLPRESEWALVLYK